MAWNQKAAGGKADMGDLPYFAMEKWWISSVLYRFSMIFLGFL